MIITMIASLKIWCRMNKIIKFFIYNLFFCFSFSCYAFDHYLTICAIFQNDSKYLPEWIEFHVGRGVQHFYLYNNLSTDDYKGTLKPYIDSGLVDLIEWPYSYSCASDWTTIQCSAYLDCVKKIKYKDYWCGFLNSDEFLF